MRLNPITLAFAGEDAALERPFLDDYVRSSLIQFRVILVLCAVFYGSFAVLDHRMMPEQQQTAWLIRFGVVCPAILLAAALSYLPSFRRTMQPVCSALAIVGGAGVTGIVLIAPTPARDQYYAGIVLVLMFSYTLLRARFLWASVAGAVVVTTYLAAAAALTDIPASVLESNAFFLIGANLAGMATGYAMEHYARRHFFLVWLLERERAKVAAANAKLESRVEARTEELQRSNIRLQEEAAERRLAEDERLRLQQQLKQAERMETIGTLAAGVAHDLNNILVGVVAQPELLLLDLPEHDPLRAPILAIKDSGLRAAAIVHDLLALSRQGVVEKRRMRLNAVVDEHLRAPEFVKLRAEHPHVRVDVALQEDLLDINGSPVHLDKLLLNLVTNAVEANLVPGTVTIATRNCYADRPMDAFEPIAEGEYAVLSVADTGVGIAAEDLRRIFEPFFTKKRLGRSGTGLGMTLVWSSVKEHGGYLDIRSAEGEGTTFDVYLPVARHGTLEAEVPFTIDDCRGSERVLVIDDIAEQRAIATQMLRKLGYDATAVNGGEEAVAFLKTGTVDILVLDMVMDPGIDGCETYRRIVEIHPGQKAVIASGYSESDRVKEAQRLGAGPYVRKPYTLERIARAIRTELARENGLDAAAGA
jgi:signal transduction histidine kinase/ActR/RegA family two-component response regulator